MAKRRRGSVVSISAERAQQALAYLVHEGKLGIREIEKALSNRDRLIREIRERMEALGIEGARVGKRLRKRAAAGLASAEKSTRKRRRKAVSVATRAARQAQGQYMAAVRRLSKSAKKRIRVIRKSSGVKAAVAAAKKLSS
jgi:hypothetical protein